MLKRLYAIAISYPRSVILVVLGLTIFFATQLPKLTWETDARVYLPRGHAAIKYDEKVDDLFGVKDSVIIGIVNEKEGIYNPNTLARIARITEKVAGLSGVISLRAGDVASLSTATAFTGTDTSLVAEPIMPTPPTTDVEIAKLMRRVNDNADLFVGNLVSADGKGAMIRAKLKEGAENRYKTYFEIKCAILPQETGDWGKMQECADAGGGGNWQQGQEGQGGWQKGQNGWQQAQGPWGQWQQNSDKAAGSDDSAVQVVGQTQDGDKFYLAGRPVIEVNSGLHALQDMKISIPMLILAMMVVLYLIFRTLRGVVLPIAGLAFSIIWTMGAMALLKIPLYTISSMLPVILVAVSIADAVHLLSHYYDEVLNDIHRQSSDIVKSVLDRLSGPLITTTITTGFGFLSLMFAEMPPFKIFGLFTILGICISWLLTVTFIPAVLTILKPKVGRYLAKRRALRVHTEQDRITLVLVKYGDFLQKYRGVAILLLLVASVLAIVGSTRLQVDSSWMSDFRKDSELVKSNDMLNEKFAGTIFLNIVIEGQEIDAFKSPELLRRIEGMQAYLATLPYVGDTLSIVDYLKSMNKSLHSGDERYNVLPVSKAEIGEYLFLLSVSGRPEQLDEIIDYDYRRGLVTVWIKTDHTRDLKSIIDATKEYVAKEFQGLKVEVNLAGSANNSYIWAKLLINSQAMSIGLSKVGILLLATLMFMSLRTGLYTVVPVTFSTLFVAGVAGFAGIPLDVSTALAAGIAIGVGVDYAVHFIFRYQYEFAKIQNATEATQATMRSVGKTIVFNAVVVIAGFVVLFFSQFPPHAKLGYFVVAYMVISCFAALTTLPILFSFLRPSPAISRDSV